ncbi:trypsin-like serine protease [Corynebacterium freiburgense]|uniref:trypsin-like serine protease n=1 Tax=Corynebacterium freiburgense TaxID=556548 RepID=UPI00042A7AAB|nr:trypsin-like serine protease [Corynebacterium freiburgense]WJZ01871.1 Trypsin [Corynebacterium freiburgense]
MLRYSAFKKGLVCALFGVVMCSEIAAAQENMQNLIGVGELPEGVYSEPYTFESTNTQDAAELVLYGFTASTGDGFCSGISLNEHQFLTSQHCTNAATSLEDMKVFGHPDAIVQDIEDLPGVDATVVTLKNPVFSHHCTEFSESTVRVGEKIDLYTFDFSKNKPNSEQLNVEQVDYVGNNPELGITSHDLLRASALDGTATQEGDSGAPVFMQREDGGKALAGIVVGVSKKYGDVIVQPIEPLIDDVLERGSYCGE